jgi:hypothetical protein
LNLLEPKPSPAVADVRKAATSKALVGLLRTVANASEGSRNNMLFWASCLEMQAERSPQGSF